MKPIIKTLEGMKVVKISSVIGFERWLYGQTNPVIESDIDPFDWAFYDDYIRFRDGLEVTD